MYRRLLLPVREPSEVEPLIRFGAMILDADGEIRTLHVIPSRSLPEVTRRWRASVNLVIPAHEAGAALDLKVDPEVRAAQEVVDGILESADRHSVDGILMTLSGDRRSRNPFVGRTASAILHHAGCDVLIVNRLTLAGAKIPRILVPTFTGSPSPKVMQLAEAISVRQGGAPIVTFGLGPGAGSAAGEEERSPRGVPIRRIRSLVRPGFVGRRHRIPELIVQGAARERYGLLLVAEEAHPSEGPLLTRRFLEDLFRRAPCPVMSVRG
jgi:nucleotide-binding universal stress UspA family protein